MFEINKEEIEINGQKYEIVPLSGRFLPKFYAVVTKLQKAADGEEFDIAALDEDVISKLQEICLETMAFSYPNKTKEELDRFVSQNMLQMIEGVIKVNLPQPKE